MTKWKKLLLGVCCILNLCACSSNNDESVIDNIEENIPDGFIVYHDDNNSYSSFYDGTFVKIKSKDIIYMFNDKKTALAQDDNGLYVCDKNMENKKRLVKTSSEISICETERDYVIYSVDNTWYIYNASQDKNKKIAENVIDDSVYYKNGYIDKILFATSDCKILLYEITSNKTTEIDQFQSNKSNDDERGYELGIGNPLGKSSEESCMGNVIWIIREFENDELIKSTLKYYKNKDEKGILLTSDSYLNPTIMRRFYNGNEDDGMLIYANKNIILKKEGSKPVIINELKGLINFDFQSYYYEADDGVYVDFIDYYDMQHLYYFISNDGNIKEIELDIDSGRWYFRNNKIYFIDTVNNLYEADIKAGKVTDIKLIANDVDDFIVNENGLYTYLKTNNTCIIRKNDQDIDMIENVVDYCFSNSDYIYYYADKTKINYSYDGINYYYDCGTLMVYDLKTKEIKKIDDNVFSLSSRDKGKSLEYSVYKSYNDNKEIVMDRVYYDGKNTKILMEDVVKDDR